MPFPPPRSRPSSAYFSPGHRVSCVFHNSIYDNQTFTQFYMNWIAQPKYNEMATRAYVYASKFIFPLAICTLGFFRWMWTLSGNLFNLFIFWIHLVKLHAEMSRGIKCVYTQLFLSRVVVYEWVQVVVACVSVYSFSSCSMALMIFNLFLFFSFWAESAARGPTTAQR